MTTVVGVDGAGRTHRLRRLATDATGAVSWFSETLPPESDGDRLVIVDDAHRLDPVALRQLTAVARDGVSMAISRRPTIDRRELAELDEAVAAGGVEFLAPLDHDGVAALVATVTGRPVSPETAAEVLAASSGMPAVAAALATGLPGTTPPALLARVQRRFAVLDPAVVTTARVLALRLELGDHALAAAAGLDVDALAGALRTLHDEGLLVNDRMIPAIADAVLHELPAASRRRVHDAVAGALVATGADPVVAAGQLRAARAATPSAGAVYRAAGERLRFADPAAAAGWFDDAADAGTDPASFAAGRAEAGALLGLPVDADSPGDARMTLVAGAVAAHQGRAARAAELLLGAAAPGPVLAVPSLVGVGQADRARKIVDGGGSAAAAPRAESPIEAARRAESPVEAARRAESPVEAAPQAESSPAGHATGPAALVRFAEGALAAGEPSVALPLLIEAAEAMEHMPPVVVLPDTPHAVAAVVAVAAGDVGSAEYLLTRALKTRIGGPVAEERHRLLLAWARMRTGRYDTALQELRSPVTAEAPGRERLLRAALAAGIARRRGDIAGLRDAWSGVEPLLARRTADLWQVEAIEELAVAAARLRRAARVEPVLDLLDEIIMRLGRPVTWSVSLDWVRLHMAIGTDDTEAAAEVAARMTVKAGQPTTVAGGQAAAAQQAAAGQQAATGQPAAAGQRAAAGQPAAAGTPALVGPGAARPIAQCAAAAQWAAVLDGRVEPEAVLIATEDLHAAELPWEASRLAGQAAIRTADPTAARRLLERARELSDPDETAAAGGLSEREVTVARLVLGGSTHREIGAQLYIAPKTVEHHVARIRGKLGASTRAELLAMLREMFGD